MSGEAVINRASMKHAYEQVADTVAGWIADGTFTIKLPSEHDLAHDFKVSYFYAITTIIRRFRIAADVMAVPGGIWYRFNLRDRP